MQRKGFPESYDRRALLRFVADVKSGAGEVARPGLLAPDLRHRPGRAASPSAARTSSSSRASTCCSPPWPGRTARQPASAVSDFFDFSLYVDARAEDVRRWYVDRFLRLRETAFADPTSYFHRYAGR